MRQDGELKDLSFGRPSSSISHVLRITTRSSMHTLRLRDTRGERHIAHRYSSHDCHTHRRAHLGTQKMPCTFTHHAYPHDIKQASTVAHTPAAGEANL